MTVACENALLQAMLVPRVAAAQASVIRMRTWLRTEEKYNDDHSCSCSCFYCYCHCSDLQLLLAVLLLFLIRAAIIIFSSCRHCFLFPLLLQSAVCCTLQALEGPPKTPKALRTPKPRPIPRSHFRTVGQAGRGELHRPRSETIFALLGLLGFRFGSILGLRACI